MSRFVVVGMYAESDVELSLFETDDLDEARRVANGERRRQSGCDRVAVLDRVTGEAARSPVAKRLVCTPAILQGHAVRRITISRAS